MFNIGGGEMIFLAILALLVFGPEGLPEIVKTVTRTVRAFRQAANDFQSEVNSALTLENQKREVAQRRRNRVLPAEAQVGGANEEGDASTLASDDGPPEAVASDSERPALLDENSPPSTAASEETAAESEPVDDDDGPGIPMAKPAKPVAKEPSNETAVTIPTSPSETPTSDLETVL